jgi:hypothetical protein
LKSVEAHLASLQKQTAALQHEADATQLRVNQGKVGFQLLERPGTSYNNVSVINGGPTTSLGATPGNVVPSAQGLTLTKPLGTTVSFGPGGLNTSSVGPQTHGTNFALARFLIGGQIDPRWSYGLRVSTKVVSENGLGNASISPSLCPNTTTTNCSFSDLNNGQGTNPLKLDYAYVQYSSPGGLRSQIGRYSVGAYGRYAHSPQGLVFGGQQITGFNVGYAAPHGHFSGQVYYGAPSVNAYALQSNGNSTNAGQGVCSQNVVGLNYASNSTLPGAQGNFNGINPNCNGTQQEIGAWLVDYFPGPRIAIGGATDNFIGKQFTFYNPSAVNCTVGGVVREATSPMTCTQNNGTFAPASALGNYLTGEGNPQLVEGYISTYFGPRRRPLFNLQVAVDRHIGTDPFTGGAYSDANAYSTSFTYASKGNLYSTGSNDDPFISGGGRRNSNVAMLMYDWYGLNSVGGIDTGNFTGAVPFTNNTGYSNPNGMYYYGAQLGHWLSDSVRVSIGAFHLQNHTNIPVGTNGTANTCPGCYVNFLSQNQLNAEMFFYFF